MSCCWWNSFNTTAASKTWMHIYQVVSKSIGYFFSFIPLVLLWFESHNFRLLRNPPVREQTFISGTQHTPLVSSSFTQSNTIDEFRNNFQKNSWHMQLKLFQLRARYESVDIRMIFTLSTKNIHTHHTVDQSLQYKPCNNYKTRAKCFFQFQSYLCTSTFQ